MLKLVYEHTYTYIEANFMIDASNTSGWVMSYVYHCVASPPTLTTP